VVLFPLILTPGPRVCLPLVLFFTRSFCLVLFYCPRVSSPGRPSHSVERCARVLLLSPRLPWAVFLPFICSEFFLVLLFLRAAADPPYSHCPLSRVSFFPATFVIFIFSFVPSLLCWPVFFFGGVRELNLRSPPLLPPLPELLCPPLAFTPIWPPPTVFFDLYDLSRCPPPPEHPPAGFGVGLSPLLCCPLPPSPPCFVSHHPLSTPILYDSPYFLTFVSSPVLCFLPVYCFVDLRLCTVLGGFFSVL